MSSKSEEKREGLKKMIAEQEAQDTINKAKAKEAAEQRKAEEAQKAKAEQAAKVKPQRERLQEKIDELRKRALGPAFTEGMRKHQIDELEKQLDAPK